MLDHDQDWSDAAAAAMAAEAVARHVRRLLQYGGADTLPGMSSPSSSTSQANATTSGTVGYDFSCLVKDITKTDCSGKSVSVWTVMTCVSAIVMIMLVICIPISLIYRSGQCAGKQVKWWWQGGQKKFPEYEEVERRAAAKSQGMPMPAKVSQFRQGPVYKNSDAASEDSDW